MKLGNILSTFSTPTINSSLAVSVMIGIVLLKTISPSHVRQKMKEKKLLPTVDSQLDNSEETGVGK